MPSSTPRNLPVQSGVHDESEYLLRHRLFEELIKEEKFLEAANCLGKLNLDSTSGKVREHARWEQNALWLA